MANPNSRATLIDYCKRRLGDPVIEINVDEDQLEAAHSCRTWGPSTAGTREAS